MKNFLKIFLVSLIVSLSIASISMASSKKTITSVSVTDIEAPYSVNRVLDTSGTVSDDSRYRITDIAWSEPEKSITGFYEVTVTLEASIGYTFSGDVTATVNGDSVISKTLLEDDSKLKIVYAFDDNSLASSTIGNATSTLRYRISVYCNKNKGSITPSIVRVLKGANQTFTITPNEGYKISDVLVDGESVGAVSEYTFKSVKEDHQIKAYFEEIDEGNLDEDEIKIDDETEVKPLLNALLSILKALKIN